MARIRTIKPEFWEDEKIAALSYPCRLFYIATWNIADDNGVFRANPLMLKAKIFPFDDHLRLDIVKNWLDALTKARMIVPISHENESYYVIRTFRSHQKIDRRYAKPLIEDAVLDKIMKEVLDESEYCSPQIEEELSEGKNSRYMDKNVGFVPPCFNEVANYCMARNNNIDPIKFIDFYTAKGWMIGNSKMKDWKAAVRTWEGYSDKVYNNKYGNADGRLHEALQ